jgi:hypothetical protein
MVLFALGGSVFLCGCCNMGRETVNRLIQEREPVYLLMVRAVPGNVQLKPVGFDKVFRWNSQTKKSTTFTVIVDETHQIVVSVTPQGWGVGNPIYSHMELPPQLNGLVTNEIMDLGSYKLRDGDQVLVQTLEDVPTKHEIMLRFAKGAEIVPVTPDGVDQPFPVASDWLWNASKDISNVLKGTYGNDLRLKLMVLEPAPRLIRVETFPSSHLQSRAWHAGMTVSEVLRNQRGELKSGGCDLYSPVTLQTINGTRIRIYVSRRHNCLLGDLKNEPAFPFYVEPGDMLCIGAPDLLFSWGHDPRTAITKSAP